PVLFFGRTLASMRRFDIPSRNQFLAKAGLPPLPFPAIPAQDAFRNLASTAELAAPLSRNLAALRSVLLKYEELRHDDPPPFPVNASRKYYYEANTYSLHSLGFGLGRGVQEMLDELNVTSARIFILTGRAGQGKTNFVCDFVENFLLK